jgi:hypothetical protein
MFKKVFCVYMTRSIYPKHIPLTLRIMKLHFYQTMLFISIIWFVGIIIFRTIFNWPNDNKEKQTFSGLFSVIFKMISEMGMQLLELFRNNKLSIMAVSPTRSIACIIGLIRDNNLKPHFLPQYCILDIGSEIKPVANSLLRLSEEIKDRNLIDLEDFENINDFDGILKQMKYIIHF